MQPLDQYAVMGNPITHSLSPVIHQLFSEQTHQAMQYKSILVAQDNFKQSVNLFQQQGGKGLNVTLPFKEEAFALATTLTPCAKLAKAVNILTFEDNNIRGDNTDGIGLCHDLENNLKISIENKRILVIGAGGAARGILGPLLERNPARLTLINRSSEKARLLAVDFSAWHNFQWVDFKSLQKNQYFDIIINATSSTLQGNYPSLLQEISIQAGIGYDLAYGHYPNPFLRWGKDHGVTHLADGLGMLVEQAALSFYIWRGVKPNTQAVIEKLQKNADSGAC